MWEAGRFALKLGLFLCSYALLVDLVGGKLKRRDLLQSGRNATTAAFACLTVSVAALWTLILQCDFSLQYVAEHVSRELPLLYKVTALWAGASGSLLFWLWLQTGMASWVFSRCPQEHVDFYARARSALNLVSVCFLLVLILDKDPFKLAAVVPADGAGLNPLLQHPAMALHPPALFVGYAAFAIPFAWTLAALSQAPQERPGVTLRQAQLWILMAWMFLTVGIVLGAWWAYEELGWGGYWAWDPVENASLLPWLTATALLHCSRMIKGSKRMAAWFMGLSILTFSLCIFGTFLTRYGLVSSMHAFPDPGLGILFMILLACLWVIALALAVWRHRRGWITWDEPVAKGLKAIVWNNWVFLLLTFVVLVGTLFPFLSGLLSSRQITLKPDYFTKITAPIGLALLLFMGICPLLVTHWIKKDWRTWGAAGVIALVALALLCPAPASSSAAGQEDQASSVVKALTHLLSSRLALASLLICVFVGVNLVVDIVGGIRKRGKFNLRWVGSRIVHVGVLLVFIGIAGADGYDQKLEQPMKPGEQVAIGPFELTYQKLRTQHGPNYTAILADVAVTRDGRPVTRLSPALAYYDQSDKRTSEVDIHRSLTRDLYLALTEATSATGVINLTVYLKPLINWIWLGSLIGVFGVVLSMLGLPRSQDEEKMI